MIISKNRFRLEKEGYEFTYTRARDEKRYREKLERIGCREDQKQLKRRKATE